MRITALLGLTALLLAAPGSPALGLPPTPPTPAAPLPSIAGSPVQGATLSCSPGGWLNATSYTYTWLAGVSQVAGPSTSNTYTLTSSDVGQLITCSVTAYNGTTPSLTPALSTPVGPVGVPLPGVPIEESPPVISGTAMQGQTATCSQGGWLNATSYSYSWQRDALNISGATGSSYRLTSADVNQAVTCAVVASNAFGPSVPAISLPILPVALSGVGGSGGGSGSGAGSSARPGGAKLAAPTVKAFSVVPRIVTMLVHGKRQTSKGATFRYTLDKPAAVLIALQRPLAGRLQGRSCVAVTRKNRRAHTCTRWVTLALLGVKSARTGANQLKFAGRVRGRLLGVGGYRAIVAAVNAAGWSKTRSAGFKVARKRISSKR
jgi:hypothetical protein